MTETLPTMFVDISQFAGEPYPTGVQRVVRGTLENFPSDVVEPIVGFSDGSQFHLVDLDRAVEAVDAVFAHRNGGSAAQTCLQDAVKASLPSGAVHHVADSYLLPEPTFRPDVLSHAWSWSNRAPERTFAIVCDALPQLEPWAFHGPEQSGTSPYFRWVASLDNVATISDHSRDQLIRTARGHPGKNWAVAKPGADGLERSSHAQVTRGSFVALGTVEPRKRIDLVLDAFELLWQNERQLQLTVVGRPGWADPALVSRLEALSTAHPDRTVWLRSCTDTELGQLVGSSAGVLYLSENEGYGLPPLEALHLGCPVIVGAELPALAGLDDSGQIRLDQLSPERVAEAIETLDDEQAGPRLRSEAADVHLPSWHDFGRSLGSWITTGLGCG